MDQAIVPAQRAQQIDVTVLDGIGETEPVELRLELNCRVGSRRRRLDLKFRPPNENLGLAAGNIITADSGRARE